MNLRKLSLASLILASLPLAVSADDATGNGGSGTTAAADLDFEVIIPSFVYFRVGTAGGVVDTVTFDLDTAGIEPGTGVTPADVLVAVELRSNTDVQIDGGLLVGGGPIENEITAASNNARIPAPDFSGTPSAWVTGPINETGTWTFSYANSSSYVPGTYNDTATYTATTL
ncbi:MAG: hypothetical protein ACWGPN_10690 [Gammaproteobacteria bacterium]